MLRHVKKFVTMDVAAVINVSRHCYSQNILDFPDTGPKIPEYASKHGESEKVRRARLLYQSRKRGMSENGLLLSNFAAKYLKTFNETELKEFDTLINKPSNDWDIFYWIMEKVETPVEYDTPVMDLLKKYCKNEDMESRYQQPDLEH